MRLRVQRLHLMPCRKFNQGERRVDEAPALPTLPFMLLLAVLEERAGEMRNISCESNFLSQQIPAAQGQEGEDEEDKRRRRASVGETIKGFMQPIHFGTGGKTNGACHKYTAVVARRLQIHKGALLSKLRAFSGGKTQRLGGAVWPLNLPRMAVDRRA